ncbi:hypothetical protein TNCV_1378381 [Trichonephila clavipes]|nr:hypothetical protein TNCV_1378381 [Trichonephila clavipes]
MTFDAVNGVRIVKSLKSKDMNGKYRSSCAMGQEAALKLRQRSEDNGFRYTTLLSDGDAKTYQYSSTKEFYGPEIKML